MSKEFGRRLAILRNNCEFTQKQVADALHIDRSTYAYYELGHTEPDFGGLVKLARIFNVSPAALIPDEDAESFEVADAKAHKPARKKSAQADLSSKNNKVYNLSSKEKEILTYYRSLDENQRRQLLEFADKITSNKE